MALPVLLAAMVALQATNFGIQLIVLVAVAIGILYLAYHVGKLVWARARGPPTEGPTPGDDGA